MSVRYWLLNETIFRNFHRKQKDGKYLIVKDPNKPVIRLYDIPDNTFESEESGDEEDDELDGEHPCFVLPPVELSTLVNLNLNCNQVFDQPSAKFDPRQRPDFQWDRQNLSGIWGKKLESVKLN